MHVHCQDGIIPVDGFFKTTAFSAEKKTTNCPNCGGKLKDTNLKRCLHCGFPLEKEKTPQLWKITKIEKMD